MTFSSEKNSLVYWVNDYYVALLICHWYFPYPDPDRAPVPLSYRDPVVLDHDCVHADPFHDLYPVPFLYRVGHAGGYLGVRDHAHVPYLCQHFVHLQAHLSSRYGLQVVGHAHRNAEVDLHQVGVVGQCQVAAHH